MELSTISKAIAGGLITALVAVLAKYGVNLDAHYQDALSVLATGLVGYLAGHIAVYFAPANKLK